MPKQFNKKRGAAPKKSLTHSNDFARYIARLVREAGAEFQDSLSKRQAKLLQLLKQRRRPGLDDTDPVLQCLNSVRGLKARCGRSLLVNGKIEMQLKLLIGRAWESGSRRRAYVIDKPFYLAGGKAMGGIKRGRKHRVSSRGGVDLLALMAGVLNFGSRQSAVSSKTTLTDNATRRMHSGRLITRSVV